MGINSTQVHKRFFRLEFGEKFEHGGHTFQKESWCQAVKSFLYPFRIRVWPWTKVRTCQLVRDARPGGKSSRDLIDARLLMARTHYFGDGCFPPHDEDRLRAIKADRYQPHKDDNRTGPSA